MDHLPHAHSFNEIRLCLMVRICSACGKGPLEIQGEAVAPARSGPVAIETRCKSCNAAHPMEFFCDAPLQGEQGQCLVINPGRQPSRIVDLGQWLSLCDLMMIESRQAALPAQARLAACQAALCLQEALKFYAPHEQLPPPTAFFLSDVPYHAAPEQFAQDHLRALLARLPSTGQHTPAPAPRRAWWQFWKSKPPSQ
ncbi:MAG: hypothetical protein LLG01_01855 [Planctomycetaceae bacterium]|nr:hypothetical protein [Planctomycetaceae bacterium]